MKKITIIGSGRFAKVLIRLLKADFDITVLSRRIQKNRGLAGTMVTDDVAKALENNILIYAVPIGKLGSVIKTHQKHLTARHLILDVLSVKVLPDRVLRELHRKTGTRAVLTHPMFGPDSTKTGFKNQIIVMDKCTATNTEFNFWQSLFKQKGLKVILMSPQEHDRQAADSQGITHFIGRVLEKMHFSSSRIGTDGARKLEEIMGQTCNDTVELFHDLQTQNPHTRQMRERILRAVEKIGDGLLPDQVSAGFLTIGVQGGQGSFSEAAAGSFVESKKLKAKIKHLFTTKTVLSRLSRGDIDIAVFAVANSSGGLVNESLKEMGRHRFKVIGEVVIPVRHFLMKLPEVPMSKINCIMAHEQVFRQCSQTLAKLSPYLKQKEGQGNMKDTARAAQGLRDGEISKQTAILGNKKLAEIYGLEVVKENLQDSRDNETTFLVVARSSFRKNL